MEKKNETGLEKSSLGAFNIFFKNVKRPRGPKVWRSLQNCQHTMSNFSFVKGRVTEELKKQCARDIGEKVRGRRGSQEARALRAEAEASPAGAVSLVTRAVSSTQAQLRTSWVLTELPKEWWTTRKKCTWRGMQGLIRARPATSHQGELSFIQFSKHPFVQWVFIEYLLCAGCYV